MAAIKALEQWCKTQCDGYRDVKITNMTTSFRNGMAFCALLHKYRPDLIDFDSLSKEDVFKNNSLAFRVAEEKLGIPALLDAEDMVALRVPDRLSILTYVSQYYNYFNGRPPTGGVKRPAEGSKEEPSEKKNLPVTAKTFVSKTAVENRVPPTLIAETLPTLTRAAAQNTVLSESSNKTGTLNSKCAACKSHVHLVQRHFVDGKLYHRGCFKCSECSSLLYIGTYKAGKEPDTFICSTRHNSQTNNKPSSSGAVVRNEPISCIVRQNGDSQSHPASRPSSMLLSTTPVDSVPKPINPIPMSWTTSAQKTQAARQKFFQAVPPVAEALASDEKPPRVSHVSGQPKGPMGSNERSRAKPAIDRKLTEGNCNNNNTCNFTIRPAERRSPEAGDGQATATQHTAEHILKLSSSSSHSVTTSSSTPAPQVFPVSSHYRDPPPQKTQLGSGNHGSEHESYTPMKAPSRCPTVESVGSPASVPADQEELVTCPSASKKGRNLSPTNASRSEMRSPSIKSHHIPVDQIVKELNDIEMKLSNLEKEGVELEKKLRSCEEEGDGDILMDPLMVDWFNLIRRKQMYIRKESELVYIARTRDLEQQQPGVEGELRRLLEKPDHLKSMAERQQEQKLMDRLVEIVDGRNAIVEGLDEDRLREVEEDEQLSHMMQNLGVKKSKHKRKSSMSKLFRRRSKRVVE
ncbi:MICAL-like protein 2a [Lampris incognitus]|uniref:MICAL-like protein 2a n=1 Tax=Lampris incognitus TaxID=2546036 RepID=UPI0024B54F9D|nr:MICAL-like protein 2a [Lampris incognitus]